MLKNCCLTYFQLIDTLLEASGAICFSVQRVTEEEQSNDNRLVILWCAVQSVQYCFMFAVVCAVAVCPWALLNSLGKDLRQHYCRFIHTQQIQSVRLSADMQAFTVYWIDYIKMHIHEIIFIHNLLNHTLNMLTQSPEVLVWSDQLI